MDTFNMNMKTLCSKDWKTVSCGRLHNHDQQENIDWEELIFVLDLCLACKINKPTFLCPPTTLQLKNSINNIKDIHLKSYCYSANYVHSILADGYKFNTDNWKNLNFQKEVHYMLNMRFDLWLGLGLKWLHICQCLPTNMFYPKFCSELDLFICLFVFHR